MDLLRMRWDDVVFAHWRVAPETVAARLPDRLDVATAEGDAWLGVVGFDMSEIRPRGVPAGRSFPELNLRTYVTHDGHAGVYFFSLDAQGIFGVVGARLFHHLPYYYARCSLSETDSALPWSTMGSITSRQMIHLSRGFEKSCW